MFEMKILKSYYEGFNLAVKTKKMAAVIFVITLFLALILAIPFGNTVEKDAGNSMAFASLLKDFNYTVYQDFMNKFSNSIKPYISIALWMGIFYLLFTIFFEGGILTILKRKEDKYSLVTFWKGSGAYFSRFFRLAVYSIIIQVVIFLVVYIPLVNILNSMWGSVESEATLFYVGLSGVSIHILLFIFILTATDYAKIMMIENESLKPFKTLLRAFGFVVKHFLSTYFLYLSLLIIPVLLFVIYFKVEVLIGMSTGLGIFLIFIIQQLLIFCRVFIKIWILGSELTLYRKSEINERSVARIPVFEV